MWFSMADGGLLQSLLWALLLALDSPPLRGSPILSFASESAIRKNLNGCKKDSCALLGPVNFGQTIPFS